MAYLGMENMGDSKKMVISMQNGIEHIVGILREVDKTRFVHF